MQLHHCVYMAKNRVVPIKYQSNQDWNYVELKTLYKIVAEFSVPEKAIFTWADSFVVLGWLRITI